MSEKQFYLLQVNDALFPIGGYSHSQGLETYIQRGIVHNVDTAREYITHKIKGILRIQNFWQPDLHTKLQRKKTCRNFCTWKNFWKHPEFLWNREKLPEKWVPVLPRPLKSLDFPSAKQGFSENIWMQEREKQ